MNRSFLGNLLRCGVDTVTDPYLWFRLKLLVFSSFAGAGAILLFAYVNYASGNLSLALGELGIALAVLANLALLRKTGRIRVAANTSVFLTYVLMSMLILTGGIHQTGIFWIHAYPILAFLLTGKRGGVFWVVLFTATAALLTLTGNEGTFPGVPYDYVTMRQGIFSFLFVSVLTYLYEKVVADFRRGMVDRAAELEEKVKAGVEALREKDRLILHQSRMAAMGEMIGAIAHQWRQPLNALALVFQNMRRNCERKEMGREQLEKTVSKGMLLIGKMSDTVDDFRNFFREDKQIQVFDVGRSLLEVAEMMEPGFESGNILLETAVEPEVMVYGFPGEYSQVLLNLFSNAKDVLEKKEGERKVMVRVFSRNGRAVTEVEDNGGGVDEGIMDKIFDPYFTTKGKEKGTGIGLYMSKVIVEEHMGGEMAVANRGEGALMSVTFPLAGEKRI